MRKSYRTKPYKFLMHCSKCVSFWGTSYSRPPIDPHFTSPLLQNPGGATGACCGAVSVGCRCSVYKSSGSVEATVLCSVKSEASHISGRSRALCSSPAPSSPPSVTTSLLDKHGRPHTADPPGKMNEKFKSESMQKSAIFYVYVIF